MSSLPLNRLFIAICLVTTLVASGLALATAAPLAPERQSELSVLLDQDCGSCHGLTRKGGLGSALLPDNIAHFTDDALIEIILEGVPGTPMPPWSRFLSREDAAWIVERLRQGTN